MYPRLMYSANGQELRVKSEEEESAAKAAGFRREAYPPKTPEAVETIEDRVARLEDAIKKLQAKPEPKTTKA